MCGQERVTEVVPGFCGGCHCCYHEELLSSRVEDTLLDASILKDQLILNYDFCMCVFHLAPWIQQLKPYQKYFWLFSLAP